MKGIVIFFLILEENLGRPTDKFDWKEKHLLPQIHVFDSEQSGCKIDNFSEDPTSLECFELFFSDAVVTLIVEQTNLFHEQNHVGRGGGGKNAKWRDVDKGEIYLFIATSFLMAQVKKLTIKDYWTTDVTLATPFFGKIFTRDRYLAILSWLHFSDNTLETDDKLRKIRSIVTHLRNAYKNVFYPFENVCIDESLMLFKGRLSFKQYIPSKRHRFGVKFFILCDCETGYILDFILYCGAGSDINDIGMDIGISGNIVMSLMEPYLDKGHTLYTDNWYTSPHLYNLLHFRKTNACGTVKANRKNMPRLDQRLKVGEIVFSSTSNILALKWQDKREVRMLSTCHNADMVRTKKRIPGTDRHKYKPLCILDYNEHMGAVDRSDMLQSSIESVRKSVKWYKKVFFHFLDMTLLNAHAVYQMRTGKTIPVAKFQLDLVKNIISKYAVEDKSRQSSSRKREDGESPLRLVARHFPKQLPKNENSKQTYRRCIVCSKNKQRKETSYCCVSCDVPLCLLPCFERYHTIKNY